jgi:hypothetical protein
LVHRTDRLEDFFAILTDIFVNWHKHLYKCNNDFNCSILLFFTFG